ncbi:MAG TPA: nitroreductase family protein [Bacteroidia bacterium]|nr:nitroreductase family protein [Bacteroidia bacterium]
MKNLELIEPIKNRYSPIIFENKNVEDKKLALLFEAAQWAASCNNEQSWRFIYAQKNQTELYSMLFNCLVDFNKEWVVSAPILMLSIAKKTFSLNGKPNRFAAYDLGQAVSSLSIQASSMGIQIHQMGGFDAEKAKSIFNLGDDFEPLSMIAIGYPGDVQKLTGKLLERSARTRVRKNIDEIFFNQALVK